jgi:N-acetylneuraminic acid mutarotase
MQGMLTVGIMMIFQQQGWEKLPSLPDEAGFASMFAGVAGDKLVAAGGANFPDKKPWEGGTKVWHDRVFVLDAAQKEWRLVGRLPRPLAYGVAVPTNDGLLCIGGSDSKTHYADCFEIGFIGGMPSFKKYPSLPKPCANMSGLRVGNKVYLMGGTEKPDSTEALHHFWVLDLGNVNLGWKELKPWPGPGRMLAVCAHHEGNLFLFSGTGLSRGMDGKPVRDYLKDAYSFSEAGGWKKLADMPRATVAAPSPAWAENHSITIYSGDDGSLVNFEPKAKHPGFPRDGIRYDIRNNAWSPGEKVPFSLATVPVVQWMGKMVIISGEIRPGIRTPEVLSKRLP